MKKIKVIALIVSVFTLLLGLFGPFSKKEDSLGKLVDVVVVKENIPQQTIIDEEKIEIKKIPENIVSAKHFSDLSEVVGKIAIIDLYEKEFITAEKISAPGSQEAGVSYLIPHGERAITLEVEASTGMAGLLHVGNYVDIISVGETTSEIILERKKVLALDKRFRENTGKMEVDESMYITVTISVTPEEALKLSLEDANAKVRAILRNPEDESKAPKTKVVKDSKR